MQLPITPELALTVAAIAAAYAVFRIGKHIWLQVTSPLRDLPGPEPSSWLFGNLKAISNAEPSELHDRWVDEYGPTIRYKVLFGRDKFYTLDTKALNHILVNTHIYQKPDDARYFFERVIGGGLLIAEDEVHKKQRKIMNPAFGPTQIRGLTQIFVAKANELRDVWMSKIANEANEKGAAQIEVTSWLNRMTLDVIGLAGFRYDFDSIKRGEEGNELSRAFGQILQPFGGRSLLSILKFAFPLLRTFKSASERAVDHAKKTVARIGSELIQESKATIEDSQGKRDLLTLLLRANMKKDVPESQKLTDSEVLSQVPTFLVAGHETTSNATTWALYALSLNKSAQTTLREELLSLATDTPSMDELNSLPYLDKVVRETLRLHCPVPATSRWPIKDDVIPLSTPITDRKGRVQTSVNIRKEQGILIPTYALGRHKLLWGEDALEFRPERWDSLPEAVAAVPGVWGNTLAFLGGPRACIGYRFALTEMKALLFSLVRAFEYELAVDPSDIGQKSAVVRRPHLKSNVSAGSQMPLLVRPYIAT